MVFAVSLIVSFSNAQSVTTTLSLPAGSTPQGIVYDSAKGEVFVTNFGSSTVSVISDTTNAIVATVALPSGSQASNAAYDSGKGEVFVVDTGNDEVSVISDSTNAVVANVSVGGVLGAPP